MSAIQNFAFEENLVRIIERGGEPWFVGKDICSALGIRNHKDALGRLDDDERAEVGIADPSGTKYATAISEPGVYRLTFTSRKEEAERFKRWLAHEVLPQIRRTGKYDPVSAGQPVEPLPSDQRMALALITEARMLYGKARARMLWESLPALPQVPALPQIAAEDERDGFACLGHALQSRPAGETTVREFIEEAFEDVPEAHDILKDIGIRAVTEQTLGAGLAIATAAASTRRLFWGTKWAAGNHAAALRTLPGAVRFKTMKFGDNRASSSIFLPMSVLQPAGLQ